MGYGSKKFASMLEHAKAKCTENIESLQIALESVNSVYKDAYKYLEDYKNRVSSEEDGLEQVLPADLIEGIGDLKAVVEQGLESCIEKAGKIKEEVKGKENKLIQKVLDNTGESLGSLEQMSFSKEESIKSDGGPDLSSEMPGAGRQYEDNEITRQDALAEVKSTCNVDGIVESEKGRGHFMTTRASAIPAQDKCRG